MKGTIRVRPTKDGEKRYTCQVFAGTDPLTGKKRYLTATAKTERQAHQVLHRLISQVDAGVVSVGRATLNDLIAAWLEAAGPAGENTRQVYAGYIRKHISPGIGKTPVSKLRVEDLDRWYSALHKGGLAPSSIRKIHNIIRGSLSQGQKWGWVATNVAARARPPAISRPVIATPAPADVGRLIAVARDVDPEMAVYLRLAAVTGARPGEMCGLRWSDVDFVAGEVAIQRRVIKTAPEPIVKDLTKTGKTRRIPLDDRTLRALRDHRELLNDRATMCGTSLDAAAFIFTDSVDGLAFWRPDSTSRRFRAVCARAGISGIHLYSLRHQAATALIDSGVDAKTVSERLGNSVATVLGTYTRARSSADRSAADLMGQLLDG